MPNAKDHEDDPYKRILNVGRTGAGKSVQLWTLPGRKFLYMFDPNTLAAFRQRDRKGNTVHLDIEYEDYRPDVLELDATLKGFNKDSKDDTIKGSKREPTVYNRWVADINEKVANDFFTKNGFDWLCFDSLTFINRAVMGRQLYINNRYGSVEDLADYRIVGSKISEVFSSIATLPINIYCTGHIQVFENEKTKRMETLINTSGNSRTILPMVFTDIWQAQVGDTIKGKTIYQIRTRPDPRGLQDIRTSVVGLEEIEDVTIDDFGDAEQYGIGAILKR